MSKIELLLLIVFLLLLILLFKYLQTKRQIRNLSKQIAELVNGKSEKMLDIKLVCFWVRFGIVTLKNMLYCTTSKTFSGIFNLTVKLCQMLCQCAGRVH